MTTIEHKLQRRMHCGNLRTLNPPKESCCDFASSDYLGLARSPLFSALCLEEWQKKQRIGSGGSRLLTGNSYEAEFLEERIAAFHGYEAGLLFNCGYMANLGLLAAVAGENETIFFDAHVHASIRDGICLSRAPAFPFRHNDLNHLEQRLKASANRKGRAYIYVESLYSTDGSKAPLQAISSLSSPYGASLIVDEAHAVGVFGRQGRGLVEEQGVTPYIFAQITTFGKALGTSGAIILGSLKLKEQLINFAKTFIYTTAMPYYQLAAIRCSYQLFPQLDMERAQLKRLIALCQSSETQIQTVQIQGNESARSLEKELAAEGYDLRALLSPTVQQGHERLRLCLHAYNTEQELLSLIQILEEILCATSL